MYAMGDTAKPAILQDGLRSQHSRGDLEHLLLQDEVLAPFLQDIALQCTAHGAQVVKTSNTTIYIEGKPIEEPALHQVLERTLVEAGIEVRLLGLL